MPGPGQPDSFRHVPRPWTEAPRRCGNEEAAVTSTILLIILIILLLGVVPAWPYSRGWGYGPSGIVGVIVVILVIMLLMGRL